MAKRKTNKTLSRIGVWATIWWGLSCGYILLLVWQARGLYATASISVNSAGFFSDWWSSIKDIYNHSSYLPGLLALVLLIWVIGGTIWLLALKKQKLSYRAALKDLFLTIR